MPRRHAVWLFALLTAGCASDLARASSPAIGCPPDEIAIDEVSVGWSETSWSARCRGVEFYCAGENHASCTPERVALTTKRPTTEEPSP